MAAEAYGIFASTLGIASVVTGLVGGGTSPDVQVGIQVGQAGDNVGTVRCIKKSIGKIIANPLKAGTMDRIFVYDTQNGFEGIGGQGQGFDNGGFEQIGISTASDGVEIGYVDMIGSDDAVCIAWMVTQNQNTQRAAWTGDWGYQCGLSWHKSSVYAGKKKGSNERYHPRCTWLDKDHTDKNKWDSIKVGLTYMNPKVNGKGAHADFDYWCHSALVKKDGKPIVGAPHPKGKRGIQMPKRSEQFTKYVIHSHIPEHAGGSRELCESSTSWGADFIDPDGMYCDMGEKKLYPLCKVSDVPGCLTFSKGAGSATFLRKDSKGEKSHFKFYERGFDTWVDEGPAPDEQEE